MEILTTAPNTPETIIRHILEQPVDWAAIVGTFSAALLAAIVGGLIAAGIARWQLKTQSEGLARANARVLYGTMILQKNMVYSLRSRIKQDQDSQETRSAVRNFPGIDVLETPSEFKDSYLVDHLILSENLKIAASYQGDVVELRYLIERYLATYSSTNRSGFSEAMIADMARNRITPKLLRVAESMLENMELLRPRVFELTGLDEDPWPSDEVLDEELERIDSGE